MRCRKMTLRQCWRIFSEDDRKQVLTLIADFRKELDKRTIGPRGRQVLDHLMPHLLSDVCAREDAAVTLSRITALLVGLLPAPPI